MTTRDNVKLEYDGVIVYLATLNVANNWTNAISSFTEPTTGDNPNTTSIINLNKVEDRYTITGHLIDGKLDASETYTTAKDKRNALKTMFGKGDVIEFSWDGDTFEIGVDKYEIDYTSKDSSNEDVDGEIVYDVVVSCIIGTELI